MNIEFVALLKYLYRNCLLFGWFNSSEYIADFIQITTVQSALFYPWRNKLEDLTPKFWLTKVLMSQLFERMHLFQQG